METPYASPTTERTETNETSAEVTPRTLFNADAIEALRQTQQETQATAYETNINEGFLPETADFYAKNSTSAVIDAYLMEKGIDRDNPSFNMYHAALSKLSINSLTDEEWAAHEEGEQPRGHAEIEAILTDFEPTPDDTATEVIDSQEAIDPAIEAANTQLDSLRLAVAGLSAKRQGRLFGDGGEKYREAMAEYNEQVIKAGKLANAEVIASEELTQEEKNAEVIAYLFEEQRKLREASLESVKGTKVHKFIEWMNKGNAGVRLLKGVGLGAAAAVVGAGAGAVLGVAGVGVAAGAAAAFATGSARFARGFARSDARRGRGMQQLDAEASLTEAKHIPVEGGDDAFETIQVHFNDKFEEDTDKEQKKRRKSAVAGLGGIALGAGIGAAVSVAADAGIFDGWGNRGLSLSTNNDTVGTESAPEPTPEPSESHFTPELEVNEPAVESDSDATGNWGPETIPDADFAIGGGEGGIHFFQRLGLTEADWYSVHEELRTQFPNDFYNEGGDTRIAHTGQLSTEAQQFIKQRFGLS